MAIRRSCDRCYKKKERCTYKSRIAKCVPCIQFDVPCTNVRPRTRPGRRPKTPAFGEHGSIHVWDSGSGSATESCSTHASQKPSPTSSYEADHEIKPCPPLPGDELIRFPKQPPREEGFPSLWTTELAVSMQHLYDVQSSSPEFFYATNDIFMLGPGFARNFLTTLRQCYDVSPSFLRDSYQAMFTALIWARHQMTSFAEVDLSRGALSLQRLRTFSVCNVRDAIAITSLGPTLAAFDVITRCDGSATILRHSLSMIQSWYPTLSHGLLLDPIITSPIFWDTAHCLIWREVPIIRYQLRDPPPVDRTAGMCTTLMPSLYDLCVASNKWRHSGEARYAKKIREIEKRIISWRPSFSTELNRSYSKQEILAMTVQASMYRTATLLIIHRLFNSIGTADDTAKTYAGEIVAKLHEYLILLGQEKKLQHTVFPVLLAALELPDLAKDTWTCLSLLKTPSICLKKLLAAVEYVWEQRSQGYSGSMFDLLEAGPEFVIVP